MTPYAAAILLLTAAEPAPVARCAEFHDVAKALLDGYGERPVAVGLSRSGTLMTLFASANGKTWTSVVTGPTGQACVVDVGQGLELKAQGVES